MRVVAFLSTFVVVLLLNLYVRKSEPWMAAAAAFVTSLVVFALAGGKPGSGGQSEAGAP